MRYWVSWFSGNYEDEGCTKPPFEFWVTGQRDRQGNGLSQKHARDDCSLCAVIDAESEDAVWKLVGKHFPDYEVRFLEEKNPNFQPGDRFQ